MNLRHKALLVLAILMVPAVALAGGYDKYKKSAAEHSGYGKKMDIVDTAKSAGTFNTLVKALKAADLVDTLRGDGPFTVFAPTDAAFAKLPAGTLNDLLKPENKAKLQSILTYHVVAGKVKSKTAATLNSAKTVNGSSFAVRYQGGELMVDKSKVIQADIMSSNGIIHVIDTVMIP